MTRAGYFSGFVISAAAVAIVVVLMAIDADRTDRCKEYGTDHRVVTKVRPMVGCLAKTPQGWLIAY